MKLSSVLHKKRGLSVVVGYAILIGMTISLSVLVFGWLRYYVDDASGSEVSCPEGVSVIVTEAKCIGGNGGYLNVTLKNKGRHNVEGYILRVNDNPEAEQGFYAFDTNGTILEVGNETSKQYYFSNQEDSNIVDLNLIDVQAFKLIDEKKVYCPFKDIVEIECSEE